MELLHALAGCVTTTTVLHAAAHGIEIESLSTTSCEVLGKRLAHGFKTAADVPFDDRAL